MTKQHFNQLAEIIRVLRNNYGESIPASALVSEVSAMCRRVNPRFDSARFARACEPTVARARVPAPEVQYDEAGNTWIG